MDDGAAYFIDTAFGAQATSTIKRKVGSRVRIYECPKVIQEYNDFMG